MGSFKFKYIYLSIGIALLIIGHCQLAQAQDYLKMGTQEQEKAHLDKAIEYYGLAIKQNPKLLPAYIKRGLCYQDLSDFDQALSDFKKANELRPDNPDIEMSMGTTYFHLKDYQNALTYLNDALDKMPDNANAQFDLGLTKTELKDYYGALKAFNKAIDLSSEKPQFYYSRALAKDQLRDFKGAMDDCSTAIKLRADYEKAYYLRAKEENELRMYKEALEDLAADIKINPKNTRYYAEKADVEYHQGFLAACIADCNIAIGLNSIFGEPYYSKALAERDSGMMDSAKADMATANKLFKGKSPLVWMEMSKILIYTGDYANAAQCAQKVLDINPKYMYGAYELAYSETFMGNDSGAAKILNHIIKTDTSFTMAYWLLGRINYLKGDSTVANQYFDRGIQSKADPVGVAFCYAFKGIEFIGNGDKTFSLLQKLIQYYEAAGLRIKKRDGFADVAYGYGVLKNRGKFFEYINKALSEGYSNKGWIENSKELDYLRAEPTYKELATKFGLKN